MRQRPYWQKSVIALKVVRIQQGGVPNLSRCYQVADTVGTVHAGVGLRRRESTYMEIVRKLCKVLRFS